MTRVPAFIDLTSFAVVASLQGNAAPSIKVLLNTWLVCPVKFIRDGVVESLPNDTPIVMSLKKRFDPDGEAVALDTIADVSGTGNERVYTLKALVTGDTLKAALAGKEVAEFTLQYAWGEKGAEDYGASLPLTILVVNNQIREGDELPSPLSSAGWEYLKQRIPAGSGVVHHEDTKTITVTPGGGTPGTDGREIELRNDGMYIQWRYVGDVGWTNLLHLDDIRGTPGDDGASVEMQVSDTHIQWREEGAPDWINLIALESLKGPKGDAGDDATGGGGSAISSPAVYYVRRDGNDSTAEAGNPAKPFLTAGAAYAAGVTAGGLGGGVFALDLGAGSFSIRLTSNWNGFCAFVRGQGCADVAANAVTSLTINGTLDDVESAPGGYAYNITAVVSDLHLHATSNGANVVNSSGTTGIYGGNAGVIKVIGNNNVTFDGSAVGGSISTGDGTDYGNPGGTGGQISLSGVRLGGNIVVNGGQGEGGVYAPAGSISSDGCDMRGSGGSNTASALTAYPDGYINFGRTTYDYGFALGAGDKGGNAAF